MCHWLTWNLLSRLGVETCITMPDYVLTFRGTGPPSKMGEVVDGSLRLQFSRNGAINFLGDFKIIDLCP